MGRRNPLMEVRMEESTGYDWNKNRMGEESGKNGRDHLPSYVIFHFAALDFEHKVEKIAPRLLREK